MARPAVDADTGFVRHAWETCFDDPASFVDWNFTRNYNPQNTLIAEVDGVPASNMQLMPYRICLGGTVHDVSYISGVATLPEYRHRGLVRELFAAAFPLMQKRGVPLSILVPFNYAFYEKFGYKECYKKRAALPAAPPQSGGIKQISDDLIADLNRIYLGDMRGKNGYILRSMHDWQLILEDVIENSGGSVYLHTDSAGMPDGYLLYADGKSQECCGVAPLEVEYDDEKPFAMARIIDVYTVLSGMATGRADLSIKVIDNDIPQNNRCFKIKENQVSAADGYDIEVDILTLTQLVFGAIPDPFGTGIFMQRKNYVNLLL